ncbi:hypothetical protein AZL_c00910 (plasmid) [Azospirillum sp. B510]|uniref:hypothetical protein n=1 Tax=Azospirillum sp. (strain B510) TaxID=137722 RepID=UPI0001C4CC29|nr:hypothetical protein [Azospirillum sp. B510]BAI75384.1 hypothetical protein AZL_c00910 [Azospirillum sp. B510]
MVETRRTGDRSNEPIRPDAGGGRVPAAGVRARADGVAQQGRQRVPSLRELAALVVNGVLTLPRNYRRGMFLDVQV